MRLDPQFDLKAHLLQANHRYIYAMLGITDKYCHLRLAVGFKLNLFKSY